MNEMNHARLLFATTARYEAVRSDYCDRIRLGWHSHVHDEALATDVPVGDQRIYVRPCAVAHVINAESTDTATEEATASEEAHTSMASFCDELVKSAARATPAPPREGSHRASHHKLTLMRANSRIESQLLLHTGMVTLASAHTTSSGAAGLSLVPFALSAKRLAEQAADDHGAKYGPRAHLIKAIEAEQPEHSELFKQALDLRALVLLLEIRDEAELACLTEERTRGSDPLPCDS